MKIIDQLNRSLFLQETPNRIVSLVPSQTELLVDLGLESKIVGVTKFCVHPTYLRKNKTIVGGTKNVDLEKIKTLKPDLVICNKEENTFEMVTQLEEFVPVWVSDIGEISDCYEMISTLGKIFGISEKSKSLINEIERSRNQFLLNTKTRPVRKVVYLIWKSPYMCAGRATFISSLLKMNNFENIIAETDSRYPEIDLDIMRNADLVLLSSEPYPFKETDVASLRKELKTDVMLVDGEYFSWYGSRLKDAFQYFEVLV